MDEINVRTNSAKAWLLATRPKTLTGAMVPVMIGCALAWALHQPEVRITPMVLCMLFAMIMQVNANFVNDYFDFMKGVDDEQRLGPKRACAQGWITAPAMRRGIAFVTLLAAAVGLPLVWFGGWQMILVGFACVVFCFLYTISFSYIGLGDVLVLVFFGIVPVSMTYWLAAPPSTLTSIPLCVWIMSVACGLVIDTLLVVNNYRDIDGDRRSGKRTLIVRIGAKGGRWLYFALCPIAIILVAVAAEIGDLGQWTWALPVVFYLPAHNAAAKEMKRINKGTELNKVLALTARNMLLFGVSVVAGLLFSHAS